MKKDKIHFFQLKPSKIKKIKSLFPKTKTQFVIEPNDSSGQILLLHILDHTTATVSLIYLTTNCPSGGYSENISTTMGFVIIILIIPADTSEHLDTQEAYYGRALELQQIRFFQSVFQKQSKTEWDLRARNSIHHKIKQAVIPNVGEGTNDVIMMLTKEKVVETVILRNQMSEQMGSYQGCIQLQQLKSTWIRPRRGKLLSASRRKSDFKRNREN
ncbi:hypothetical protein L1887_15563 [Cichorium endivia]|nr:hypothetical protein L1887_15563 [Cichorium endivia]